MPPRTPPNAGAAALATLGLSQRELGRRVGLSHTQVGRLLVGAALPSPEQRERLAAELGIAPPAWDATPPPAAPTPSAAGEPTTSPVDAPSDAVNRLRALLARVDEQRAEPGLSAKTRVELAKLEVAIARELAKHDGSELTPEQVAASPHFTRIVNHVFDALEAHPLAQAAADDAFNGDSVEADLRERHPGLCAAVDSASATLRAALAAELAAAA